MTNTTARIESGIVSRGNQTDSPQTLHLSVYVDELGRVDVNLDPAQLLKLLSGSLQMVPAKVWTP